MLRSYPEYDADAALDEGGPDDECQCPQCGCLHGIVNEQIVSECEWARRLNGDWPETAADMDPADGDYEAA